MRKQEIFPEAIILATVSLAAETGLESVTTRKVAERAGIAEGSIFNYFRSKRALLIACLYYIDGGIDKALKSVPFQGFSAMKNVRALWYAYFNFLVSHGDCAKYYRQFRHSHYYDEEVMHGQGKSFAFFYNFLLKNMSVININAKAFWVFLIETTLDFAIRVSDGSLPGDPEDVEQLYNLLMHGVAGALKKGSRVRPL